MQKLPTLALTLTPERTGVAVTATADIQPLDGGKVRVNLRGPFGFTVGGAAARADAEALAVALWRAADLARQAEGADPHEILPGVPAELRRAASLPLDQPL